MTALAEERPLLALQLRSAQGGTWMFYDRLKRGFFGVPCGVGELGRAEDQAAAESRLRDQGGMTMLESSRLPHSRQEPKSLRTRGSPGDFSAGKVFAER
jgi:hypothetical protein